MELRVLVLLFLIIASCASFSSSSVLREVEEEAVRVDHHPLQLSRQSSLLNLERKREKLEDAHQTLPRGENNAIEQEGKTGEYGRGIQEKTQREMIDFLPLPFQPFAPVGNEKEAKQTARQDMMRGTGQMQRKERGEGHEENEKRTRLAEEAPHPSALGGARGIVGNQVWKLLKPYYLPMDNFNNSECEVDVDDKNFKGNADKLWFLKMVDSWGKLPDGLFFGNLRATGMFEECVATEAAYNTSSLIPSERQSRNYTGRHCNIYYVPRNLTNQAKSERSGVVFSKLLNPLPFYYATCIPSTCYAQDLSDSLAAFFDELDIDLVRVTCHAEDDPKQALLPEDKAMLSLLGIFGILVLLCTIDEVATRGLNKSPWKAVVGWSLYSNFRKVFTYDPPPPGTSIPCLGALRVITITWIIINHQYETGTNFVANTFDSLSYQDPVFAQVVTNGWLSVDTFFFMTGLLLTYRLFPHLKPKDGPLVHASILVKTIVRRIFRLAPTILFVALFSASLLRFLAYGPFAYKLQEYSRDTCGPNWWKDPIFINNYIIGDHEPYEIPDCLDHCWYTAVDMQLLLFLLPCVLLPCVYHRIAGLVVLSVATLGSILVPMSITIALDLPPLPLPYLPREVHFEYMWRIFQTPWCRAGPWLVGVWAGLILRDPVLGKMKMKKVVVILGYIAAISLGLVLVLGLFPYNHVPPDRSWQDNPAVGAIYGSLARPVWGLCVAWVVITCHTGNAAVVNRVLSYPGWRPLARLTFGLYLIHPVVQKWWASVQYVPLYYNYLNKLLESLGVTFISGVLALLLTWIVEMPIRSSIDLILPSPAKTQEVQDAIKNKKGTKVYPMSNL